MSSIFIIKSTIKSLVSMNIAAING